MADSALIYLAGWRMVCIQISHWSVDAARDCWLSSNLFCNMMRHSALLNYKTFHSDMIVMINLKQLKYSVQYRIEKSLMICNHTSSCQNENKTINPVKNLTHCLSIVRHFLDMKPIAMGRPFVSKLIKNLPL